MDQNYLNEVIHEFLGDKITKNVPMKYVLFGVLRVEDLESFNEYQEKIHITKDLLPIFMFQEEPQTLQQQIEFDEIIDQTYGKMCYLDLQFDVKLFREDLQDTVEQIINKFKK